MGAYVDSDISALTTSVTTLTGVTWPAHGGDDLAILAHAYGDGTNTGTLDGNFTSLADLTDTNLRAIVAKRTPASMTGSESGDVALTTTTGARQVGAIALYSGYTDVQQIVNQPEGSVTPVTTHASPAITPQVAGSGFVIIYMDRVSAGNTTVSPPAGFTLRKEFGTVGTGGIFMHVADDLSGTHGLTPFTPGSWNVAVGSTSAVVVLLELAPADIPISGSDSGALAEGTTGLQRQSSTTDSATLTDSSSLAISTAQVGTDSATLSNSATVTVLAAPPATTTAPVRQRSFRIEIFDEDLNKQGRVGKYLSCDVVLKHLGVGTWSLLLDLDDRGAALLAVPGRRVTIDFEDDGTRLLSGPMDSWEEIEEIGGVRTIAFFGYDDTWWLDQRLAYQVPGATLPAEGTSFTQASHVDIRAGNGETVAKGFVTANAITRFPIPHLVVAPNLGRGTSVSFNARMHSLLWMTTISTQYSGLGFRVDQVGSQLVFDVYQPQVQPVRLSKKLGNLTSYRYKVLSPAATHATVGGAGESTARVYMQDHLPASAVGWGAREKYVDTPDANSNALLQASLDSFLAAGAPTAGFSLTPRDTRAMKFAIHYNKGDRVAVELLNGTTATDTVKEVKLSHTVADGMVITPGIGYSESTDPTAAIYRYYVALRDRVANRERSV